MKAKHFESETRSRLEAVALDRAAGVGFRQPDLPHVMAAITSAAGPDNRLLDQLEEMFADPNGV